MNIRNTLISFIILILILGAGRNAVGGKVYQWTDEEGGIQFSNVPPEDTSTKLAYKKTTGEKIYQWTDEDGGIQYSDAPPVDTSKIEIREINIESFDDSIIDSEWYSIINQAERMAEERRQIQEERLAGKILRLEERRMAQELEIIRLNEFIRTYGYGPRPYYYPYPQSYYYHQRQHAYYHPGYP